MPSRALEVSVDGIGADVGAVEALVDEVGAFGERGPHDAAGGRGRRRRSRRRRGGRRRGRRRSAPASAPEQARRQRPDENSDLSPRAVGAVLVVLLHDSSFLPGAELRDTSGVARAASSSPGRSRPGMLRRAMRRHAMHVPPDSAHNTRGRARFGEEPSSLPYMRRPPLATATELAQRAAIVSDRGKRVRGHGSCSCSRGSTRRARLPRAWF